MLRAQCDYVSDSESPQVVCFSLNKSIRSYLISLDDAACAIHIALHSYFDFISMAQYATISRGMQNGLQIFTEKVGADGESQTVQRDPVYADNALLPIEHANRVGDKILAYMTEVS
jgi:hypothetical protein